MATVTVGCKLPHGLHLDIAGTRVTLAGRNAATLIGGHGLTEVDKEFFENWKALNPQHPALVNGFIFAHDKRANAEAEAKEKQNEKTGTEGLNPDKPAEKIEKLEK
jgi:hypothetical protein